MGHRPLHFFRRAELVARMVSVLIQWIERCIRRPNRTNMCCACSCHIRRCPTGDDPRRRNGQPDRIHGRRGRCRRRGGNFGFNTRRRYQQHKREYCLQNEYRSKTLPARPTPLQAQKQPHPQTRLGSSSCLGGGQNTSSNNNNSTPPHNGETSRVLFLLYLIHRTWNVVMDTMDSRTKR